MKIPIQRLRQLPAPATVIMVVGLLLACQAIDWAQDQAKTVPSPAVSVTVRLVLVDAVVMDRMENR